MLFQAAALLAVATAASASIEANLAYLSPSKQVRSLAVDTTHLKKRTLTGTYQGGLNFTYGIASGDPEPNSVILWTHPVPSSNTSLPVCLDYAVSCVEDMSNPVTKGQVWTSAEVDYSAKVEAFGLQPWKEYYYQFSNCHAPNNTSPVGAFKTIPQQDDDQISAVSLAVYSCSNLPFGYFNAYGGPVARKSVDFVVHVGDYIYEEQGDGSPNSYGNGTSLDRVPLPNKEIISLEDYRTRYKSYRVDLDLQELHRTHAWQLVWDDHEVADNTYNMGSADSNDTAAGTIENTTFTQRKANAVRAYFEWQPIRQVDTNDHLRIWRKFRFGTLADLFMLDTRQYDRDITDLYYNTKQIAAMSNDQNRSLMGSRQEEWFYDGLVQSKQDNIDWKVVGQQIVYANINYSTPTFQLNYDAWSGYQSNRQRVLNTIADNSIDNVVFLAGDSHVNWVSDLVSVDAVRNGSYDKTSGAGSLGVEFAGTAVSSPSSYGQNLNLSTYTAAAQKLANVNSELQWAEGAYRGYFELALSRSNATATFIGYPNVRTRNQDYTILSTFTTEKGSNKLTRPIAGGYIQGGALKTGN